MKPIAEVAMLTFKHEGTYGSCPGCAICKRIEQLRTQIDRPPEEKFKHILAKGENMTTSDIKLLLENEVRQLDIKKSLGLTTGEFWYLLKRLGLRKKDKNKEKGMESVALTKEKLKEYMESGLSSKQIAQKEGVSIGTVSTYKSNYGLTKKAAKKESNNAYESVKQEVAAAIATDPSLTEKLQARISELEEQMMEHYRKRVEAEEKVQNLEAAAEDLEKENEENAQKARRMEEEMNNFAAEVDEWRERARSYAEDNERLNDANKDLRMLLQESQRKEKLYAAALKEAL